MHRERNEKYKKYKNKKHNIKVYVFCTKYHHQNITFLACDLLNSHFFVYFPSSSTSFSVSSVHWQHCSIIWASCSSYSIFIILCFFFFFFTFWFFFGKDNIICTYEMIGKCIGICFYASQTITFFFFAAAVIYALFVVHIKSLFVIKKFLFIQ